MKKKTISAILTAVNIVLVIAIILLIVRIGMREPLVESDESTGVSDNRIAETVYPEVSANEAAAPEEMTTERVLVAVPQTTSNVNVRSGPGTEYERIGSAYADFEYEVEAVYENGWTKLSYEGKDGYISSEFLTYRYREQTGDSTSYTDVPVSELPVSEPPAMEPPAAASENQVSDNTAVQE